MSSKGYYLRQGRFTDAKDQAISEPKQRRKGDTRHTSPAGFINHSYDCQRKTPLHCPNDELVEQLTVIVRHREASGDDRSIYSYSHAIAAIKAYPKPLDSGLEATTLYGVGPKIGQMVDQWISNGRIEEVETCKQDEHVTKVWELMRVFGIGPKHATKLISKGIETVEQLRAAVTAKKVQLKHDQLIGLKYVEDLEHPISRMVLEEMAERLSQACLDAQLPKCQVIIVGGYRRGKVSNHDADILISPVEQESSRGFIFKIVSQLEKEGLITDILQVTGDDKEPHKRRHRNTRSNSFGKCIYRSKDGIHRHLDIIVAPKSQVPFALLGWTGSRQFERSIRLYAEREKKMSLSSESLVDGRTGRSISAASEEDIFKILGLEYINPEFRNC